ncbi:MULTISPECIES: hypothetical protein [Pseudomonas]|uniref:hypothetical protein n=1 Tax=Pseudomonas TaxID=286 RepID=UPI000BA310B2|nr:MULTISPECIES: hypothetical protein [Pseudomonas]MDR9864402.1 hypothetical protein [Pseudomonas baetica]
MSNKSTPKKLVHYSKSDLGDFTKKGTGRFKVRTQGRIYALDIDGPLANTSTLKSIKSALVFTDEALEHFEIHPWRTFFFWKRCVSQYRTVNINDMKWDAKDTVMHGSNVLQVKKMRKRSGNNLRIKWQRLKVGFVSMCDWFVFLLLLSVFVTPALGNECLCVVKYKALLNQTYDFVMQHIVLICALAVGLPAMGMTWSRLKTAKNSQFPFHNVIRQI